MTTDTIRKINRIKATAPVYKQYKIDNIFETIHKVKDRIQLHLPLTKWKIQTILNILR